jgi:hypothetical protein
MAGQVYEEGKLYYIFLRPELMTTSAPAVGQEQTLPQEETQSPVVQ